MGLILGAIVECRDLPRHDLQALAGRALSENDFVASQFDVEVLDRVDIRGHGRDASAIDQIRGRNEDAIEIEKMRPRDVEIAVRLIRSV